MIARTLTSLTSTKNRRVMIVGCGTKDTGMYIVFKLLNYVYSEPPFSRYCEHPNTGLVRIWNGRFLTDTGQFNTGPKLSGFAKLDHFIQNIFFFYV
jgi:hypothetical protein